MSISMAEIKFCEMEGNHMLPVLCGNVKRVRWRAGQLTDGALLCNWKTNESSWCNITCSN